MKKKEILEAFVRGFMIERPFRVIFINIVVKGIILDLDFCKYGGRPLMVILIYSTPNKSVGASHL